MSTRRCVHCDREKSIKGVWYLTPGRSFLCESCFALSPPEPLSVS